MQKHREVLWRRQGGKCGYCRRPTVLPAALVEQFHGPFKDDELGVLIEELLTTNERFKKRWHDDLATLEHVVPKAAGGGNDLTNLIMACASCNQEAGALYLKQREAAKNKSEKADPDEDSTLST